MVKTPFERVIGENEEDLQRIRLKYFPLIESHTITGYNLYLDQIDYSGAKLFLNYFHSDLKEENKHFEELSKVLKDEELLEERIILSNRLANVVERNANYLTRADWEDPPNMRYFNFNANELKRDIVSDFGDLIGESIQFDLLLKLRDERELRKTIDIFKEYACEFKLDKLGRKIFKDNNYQFNQNAIINAWDIPLLICTSKTKKKPKCLIDFLKVNQFNIPEEIGKTDILLSTLVRKRTKDFKRFLNSHNCEFRTTSKYALRPFVEEYIDL